MGTCRTLRQSESLDNLNSRNSAVSALVFHEKSCRGKAELVACRE